MIAYSFFAVLFYDFRSYYQITAFKSDNLGIRILHQIGLLYISFGFFDKVDLIRLESSNYVESFSCPFTENRF